MDEERRKGKGTELRTGLGRPRLTGRIRHGDALHSGRRALQWRCGRSILAFPVSMLLVPLAPFLSWHPLLFHHTLCGKLQPQTTTLTNSNWILSARPTPPPGTGPGLRPRSGVSDRVGVCNSQSWWLQFQLLLGSSGSPREGRD